jgi:hypothetical protein
MYMLHNFLPLVFYIHNNQLLVCQDTRYQSQK